MRDHDEGELYRRLAGQYVDAYGAKLKHEQASLPMVGTDEKRVLNALDTRVKGEVRRIRMRRTMTAAGTIAATLIILFMVVPMLRSIGIKQAPEMTAQDSAQTVEGALETAEAPAAMPEAAAPAPKAGPEKAEESAPASGAGQGPIPISFELPENLSVSDMMQDRESTVYRLKDAMLDDVVLTLEYAADIDEQLLADLNEIDLGSQKAYGVFGADYSYLALERGGIVYTMTCKYDLNTLIGLGRKIAV